MTEHKEPKEFYYNYVCSYCGASTSIHIIHSEKKHQEMHCECCGQWTKHKRAKYPTMNIGWWTLHE
jgi:hypothetical protein